MARQARTVIPGQAMHVLVRGKHNETLFQEQADYTIYLEWLRLCRLFQLLEFL